MRQKETKQNKIKTNSEIFLMPVSIVWCTWLMVKTGDNDIGYLTNVFFYSDKILKHWKRLNC